MAYGYGSGYRANRPRRGALTVSLPVTPPVTPPAVAPTNSTAPALAGTAREGQTLSTTNGAWTGNPSPAFTYQWRRGGSPINGATASTYVLATADVGASISCAVTATNAAGAATAASNSIGPIASAPATTTVPAKMTPPALVPGDSLIQIWIPTNTDNGGSPLTRYDFRMSTDNGNTWTITGTIVSRPTVQRSLVNGTTYTVQTRAANAVGDGPWSDSATATPVAP